MPETTNAVHRHVVHLHPRARRLAARPAEDAYKDFINYWRERYA